MLAGLKKYPGRILLELSGDDLTAAEFANLVDANRQWKAALQAKSTTWHRMPTADHTFSTRAWRDDVASRTLEWVLDGGARGAAR
jgi:hypothetical protein